MSLRKKLILILSVLVIGAALLVSSIVYLVAQAELEKAAEVQLQQSASLLAEIVQRRFDAELRKFEYWAAMPLVVNMAMDTKNDKLRAFFESYFSNVIKGEPYTTIFLVDLAGDCVACDDPRRLYQSYCRTVVSIKPTAKIAFDGQSNIGKSQLSVSTCRPIVTLTVPVWHNKKVIAVLRTSVDMGRLMKEMLASVLHDNIGSIFLYDPSLPKVLPEGTKPQLPALFDTPYQPPPEALQQVFESSSENIFRYSDKGEQHMVARASVTKPSWFFLVSRPLSEILAPIHTLRQITIIVISLCLLFLITAIFLITAPMVRGIEQCRKLAEDISSGNLEMRLNFKSSDEVGQLGRDLNAMAQQLQVQQSSLEDAELKYRTLFEQAVEGIFQTSADSKVLTANAALASMLGAETPAQIIGKLALDFYSKPSQRKELVALLQRDGMVDGFEIDIVRVDGSHCNCELTARAKFDANGKFSQMRGILLDVTERRQMETAREHALEMEQLLCEARWQTLRYQLNPHFIFNVLTSVEALSHEAPDKIPDLTRCLAAYLRLTLEPSKQSLVPTEREQAAIQSYLAIEQIRFEERLQIEFNFDESVAALLMPDLLLQPLVENALKFGMKTSAMPLQVKICVCREDDLLCVQVKNSGSWSTDKRSKESSGIGLKNLRSRLELLYGTEYRLTTEEDKGWVCVTVNMPVRESGGECESERVSVLRTDGCACELCENVWE